ncbi:MAG: CCA tRNA nucleotidyltransferase [Deltaproteobacteria bacterium]|nr:CCA tRNA nucleotidyltransferase [Candidatus Anaeroferrophillus wilburensis]MBN2888867.1 CCA tRNA nucleotidyltransferase [Deltaproteobacteria bacterium]
MIDTPYIFDADALQAHLGSRLPGWTRLMEVAHRHCLPLFIVGGTVRNLILERQLADVDLVCRPQELAIWEDHLATIMDSHFFTLGKDERITRRLVSRGVTFDLTPMEGRSITEDLRRRDFTINAMAYGIHDDHFHDPHAGLQALAAKKIIAVHESSLDNDPLRILRAVRFSLGLDYCIDPATIEQMRNGRQGLLQTAGERIGSEFHHILTHERATTGIRLLRETRALFTLFPSLFPLQGLTQNEFHHRDVLDHTFEALEHLDRLTKANPFFDLPLTSEQTVILKWAGLFHDTGKTLSKTIDPDTGSIHFYGHERFSAHFAQEKLATLGLGKKVLKRIVRLVQEHLAPLLLTLSEAKPKTLRKLVFTMEEDLPLLLLLAEADTQASRGKNFDQRQKKMHQCLRQLLTIYEQERESFIKPLISGKDLLTLGLEPGPQIGVMIRAVHQRQVNGECSSREAALDWVRQLMGKPETEQAGS